MIFLTLGTHNQPFERAIDLVAPLCGHERVVIQHGQTPARPELRAEWHESLTTTQMRAMMRAASTVICHAGVGCIMTALAQDRHPIVVPRLHCHGEHVDDHQLEIAGELDRRGVVVMHVDGEPLALTMSRTATRQQRLDLSGCLRSEIEAYVRRPAQRRRGHGRATADRAPRASSSSGAVR